MSDQVMHAGDGLDERGRALEIVIRIGVDGRVYLHDVTPDLLPVVEALNPRDATIRKRMAACRVLAEAGMTECVMDCEVPE